MRLATYNVEWFDALFQDDGTLWNDDGWSARYNVTRAMQTDALGHVFRALDADAVMIVEAPDTSRKRDGVLALETFAEAFDLRARKAVIGFANDTQQEIALLYDPDVLEAVHDPGDTVEAPAFDGTLKIDLDIDATADEVVFSKPPLEVAVTVKQTGQVLHVIGAHLKSKAPHGAEGRDAVMRQSIANRRKQLAQAIWVRRRVSGLLQAGRSVLVMGDLNDGPGLDEYEHLFGRSSVEIVMGSDAEALYDPHAARALMQRIGAQPTTARFYLRGEARYLQALLDYIFVSRDLRRSTQAWRIWHPFDDPACWQNTGLRDALLTASDHFPVTLDIEV